MARPMKPKTPFAERLIIARGDTTRDEIARLLDVHPGTYAHYERGDREPDLAFFELLSQRLDVDLNWLLTGVGEMRPRANARSNNAQQKPRPVLSLVIDSELLKKIGRLLDALYADENGKLPADAKATEMARAYNLLLDRAEDASDTDELMSLLPWLETRLGKELTAAKKSPGTGKRSA